MIENVLQLKTSEFWLGEFKEALESVETESNMDPVLKDLIIKSHQSIIDELTVDIKVFKENLPTSFPSSLS